MKKNYPSILLLSFCWLLHFLISSAIAQPTLQGYNNSRLIDQLTDDNGNWIVERVEAIRNIPLEHRAVMRFPGGTAARRYDIDCGGYDCRGKQYGGRNAVELFVELMQNIGGQVTIVLSVGAFDGLFWNLDDSPEAIARTMDKNRRLISAFVDAGIPIFSIELGNEEYLHIPKGNYRPPTWNYNFFQRLLGEPGRDARYREEVNAIYAKYVAAYERNVGLVDSFGLPAAIPMVSNEAHRHAVWNSMIRHIPTTFGVFHHYERDDRSKWQYHYDLFLEAIREQGRIPICTEWNSNHGDAGADNLGLAFSPFQGEYQSWFRTYSIRQQVPLIMLHRLNGNPATWSPPVRQNQVQPNIYTPYDWLIK
jgi:hypothetical protein